MGTALEGVSSIVTWCGVPLCSYDMKGDRFSRLGSLVFGLADRIRTAFGLRSGGHLASGSQHLERTIFGTTTTYR